MNLDELLGLPKSGVVVLKKDDSVLVSYTTNMASELQDLYNLFHGKKGIVLSVFSSGADIETLKLHTEYFRRHYHSRLCYKPITEYNRKTLKYRIRSVPSNDFKNIDVELVTARGDSKIVGRFDSQSDADQFIDNCYKSSNPHVFPVYSINSKELLTDKKMLIVR